MEPYLTFCIMLKKTKEDFFFENDPLTELDYNP